MSSMDIWVEIRMLNVKGKQEMERILVVYSSMKPTSTVEGCNVALWCALRVKVLLIMLV